MLIFSSFLSQASGGTIARIILGLWHKYVSQSRTRDTRARDTRLTNILLGIFIFCIKLATDSILMFRIRIFYVPSPPVKVQIFISLPRYG